MLFSGVNGAASLTPRQHFKQRVAQQRATLFPFYYDKIEYIHSAMSLFFLTRNEEKVYFATGDTQESVTEIARKVKIPRTSAEKALKNLEKLGLVVGRKVREKNKHVYLRADQNSVNALVEDFRASLLGKNKAEKMVCKKDEQHKVTIFSGREGIIESLYHMLSIRVNERVYGIQGSDALKSWLAYLGEEEVVRLHNVIKENKLIMVGVRSSAVKKDVLTKMHIRQTYKGRLAQTHAIPDEFFQDKLSIYVFRDTLLFINLQEEVAFEVVDKVVVSGILKLIRFILTKTDRDDLFVE